jgi:hypothetical protein
MKLIYNQINIFILSIMYSVLTFWLPFTLSHFNLLPIKLSWSECLISLVCVYWCLFWFFCYIANSVALLLGPVNFPNKK